ncbi:uncharacterized protein SPPG_03555 [Spizellomyces punctatus DAOM BR117]|uniref:Prefoldin subunit 4 n=1 Tax=Spizellomyces punctatus (strain DAOM BR117) TaxID=645134 RepID=A0A0L0HL31_SPIPD|nr:uncharacterized protein SPPG_03555 [Spizellomyces punctatus DAOM BR117]KND01763.1 hypothetical protein SPPG_03555 [Spizellomyces punctatus DAOM BR117]|eukprot:XP_016609802.1 hypothetical protein SPPG_03555 [Spizellomyces punctatus DAOM BR117]
MKMLNQEEEADAEVTWEDQQNINAFSRLNMKLQNLEEAYEEKKKEKEYLDDLSSELELADEDELIKIQPFQSVFEIDKLTMYASHQFRYRIGDAFVSLPLSTCQERIEEEQSNLSDELGQVSSRIGDITEKMNQLKVILYKKFGNSINLER